MSMGLMDSFSQKLSLIKTRAFCLLMAVALLGTLVIANVPKAHAVTTPGPRVSFTFDDGLTSALTEAAPTLAKYGFTGTEYVTTGCVGMTTIPNDCHADGEETYMTWEQLTQLQAMGWEIGAHTDTHPLLASTDPDDQPQALTNAQVIQELSVSKQALAAHGFDATSFASPYGDWNQTVLAEIAKLYSSHRGFADVGYNSFPYNDYLLYDQQVQAGVTVAQVKAYVDQAKANNQWLILTFHDIAANASTDPDEYEYKTADLDAIAAYVKSLNIPVVNVKDGIANGTNLLAGGTFEAGLSNGWNTDAPSNITANSANHGSNPGATNSISMTATTANAHLFSPIIAVDSTQAYVIKCFLNVTARSSGEVAFYVDEYDANGVYLSNQYKKSEASMFIENLNFEYKPTSAAVKQARVQVVVTANSGINAFFDNAVMFSQGLTVTLKAGDVNGDNLVDIVDLSFMASNWGKTTGATRAQGDLNGDGAVDIIDLSILASNWSK